MNKYFSIANIVIALFILSTLGDIVSTIMAANKHTVELETNPFNVWGVPLWVLLLTKMIVYTLFLLFCTRWYHQSKVFVRYYLIFFLTLMTILQIAVTSSNFMVYKEETGSIVPIPKEERVEMYMEGIGDLKVMQTIEPTPNGFKIPFIFYLFGLNILAFIIWYSFERRFDMYGVK